MDQTRVGKLDAGARRVQQREVALDRLPWRCGLNERCWPSCPVGGVLHARTLCPSALKRTQVKKVYAAGSGSAGTTGGGVVGLFARADQAHKRKLP